MEMTERHVIAIAEQSQVGEARRLASTLAQRAGFDEEGRGRVAVVATEAARNLIAHGGGGEILMRVFDSVVLELLAVDKGRGMADVGRCLVDGYSTAGTPGTGLGAISRMSDLFDIYSMPDRGTALLALLAADRAEGLPRRNGFEYGCVCVPKPGEEACGDAWFARSRAGAALFSVIDGLGHGAFAADASRAAIEALAAQDGAPPAAVVEALHGRLRSTRGAAGAVASVDRRDGTVRYAGIGNVAGAILTGADSRSMVSHNGTLGHQARRFQEFSYPWAEDSLIVMHSDGLASHWSLDRYPGLTSHHPALVAGVLYRDFTRGRDDVTVLVARAARGEGGA
jgi:anti-sigma regulatory factor (Ser/Thr protein kinase)